MTPQVSEQELIKRHPGQWIVILKDGRYFTDETPERALSQVPHNAVVKDIFRAPQQGGEALLFYYYLSLRGYRINWHQGLQRRAPKR